MEAEQNARKPAHGAADEERQSDDPIDGNPHQRSGFGILRDGANCRADPGPINEEMEGRKHEQRRYDDEDRLHRHDQIRRQWHGLVKKIQGRIAKIKSVTPKTLEKTQGVLEKK